MIVGTRAMGAAGVGLLVADKLPKESRKAIGWTLALVGAVTTVPLAISLFGKK